MTMDKEVQGFFNLKQGGVKSQYMKCSHATYASLFTQAASHPGLIRNKKTILLQLGVYVPLVLF